MREHVVTLGGGHGVAAVLRALRMHQLDVTVIVTVADDGGSSGVLHRRWGRPAVGDMRRSLIALTGERDLPGRALAAPVTLTPSASTRWAISCSARSPRRSATSKPPAGG